MRKTLAFLAFSLLAILPRSMNAQQTTIRVNCGIRHTGDPPAFKIKRKRSGLSGSRSDNGTSVMAIEPGRCGARP